VRGTPRLLEATNTEGCRIWLRFEDGVAAEVDFSDLLDLDGVFLALRDPDFFREVAIYPGGATIFWPGEVDVAPETVYERTQEAAAIVS
jgi:hypothetical protein